MKKIIAMLLASVLSFSVVSCGGKTSNEVKEESKESNKSSEESKKSNAELVVDLSDITIGACVMSLQHEFMANLVKGYNEFMAQTNCNIVITDGGNMEPEKQVTNVENYLSQGVDGILLQCISVDTMKDSIKKSVDSGIPIGIYPYDKTANATTYFGYDEHEWGHHLGTTASEWIKNKLNGEAKIISVYTSLEEPAVMRRQGWVDAINELCDKSKIKWIDVEATSSEDAMANVESALQANPDAEVVLVYNDEMGIGAFEAIKQSGLDTTNMFLGSCDGTDTVLDYVQQDTVYRCTVGNDKYVSEIGFYWAENMVKIILGMEYQDPFEINTMSITPENIEAYRNRKPEYKISQDVIDFVNSKKH